MGHTVVLGFDDASIDLIHRLTDPFHANKIPYGRKCNRQDANEAMDYHMTLCHWPQRMDESCLARINGFHSVPCQVQVRGTQIMMAEENSWLLYFDIVPTDTFMNLKSLFEKHTGLGVSSFYHVTLAVSKEYAEISRINDHICRNQRFPFTLTADRLDLYHIWRPTCKVTSF